MISNDMKVQHQDLRELTKVLKKQNSLLEELVKAFKEYKDGCVLSECVSGNTETFKEGESE